MAKKTGKPSASKKPATAKRLTPLPSVWVLTKTSAGILAQNKKLFAGITLVYGVLSLILVQGLAANTDVASLKQQLNTAAGSSSGAISSSFSIFTTLIGSSGKGSTQTASTYQFFLGLITSLAVIWALRQRLAGTKIRVRDAYYKGMYPLIPFVLVLIVIGLQLIPLLIGSSLYNMVIANGIAASGIEKALWVTQYILFALLSAYMISSSIFALYIVTLPDMTPLKALRSARGLVQSRRWTVFRKLISLPFILVIVGALIMVPVIIVLAVIAQWVFFLLSMFALAAAHTYLYTLYRELLNE